jgi:diguanylate cyclase (GGDEF)-like protein
MALDLKEVLDEHPNPVYIIKPIVIDGKSEDFEYVYVNKSFCIFIGRSREELVNHCYLEIFKEKGEKIWLDLFVDAALFGKHVYVNNISSVINKKMYTEVFHIDPDLCGCIIHDFQDVSNDMKLLADEELKQKANCDYLTGFYNRFYLKELYDEISKKTNIGITFLDINNLKITNDTIGHAAGDKLIIRTSDMMRTHYKDSIIFRVGGDEFVIVTIGKNYDEFMELSREGQALFENDNLAAVGYHFYEKISDLKACIDECDCLMYEQKKKMKNLYK